MGSKLTACCDDRDSSNIKENHYQILAADYRSFKNEKWYTFQRPMLFDPQKFIFLYANYEQQQESLLKRWKYTIDIRNIEYGETRNQDDVMSARWKYAIKRGVPVQYYKNIISVIFNKNFMLNPNSKASYEKSRADFRGTDQNYVREMVKAPFLNEKGFVALRALLAAVQKKIGEEFYLSYLTHVAALLLIFFEEYQAYELLSMMLDESFNMSNNRAKSFRWHFVFKQEQSSLLAESFYQICSKTDVVSKLERHCSRNQIDKVKLFCVVVDCLFYGFLPFSLIVTIFLDFLNEGVKIFFRLFYGLVLFCEKEILESNNFERCLSAIKKKCLILAPDQRKQLLKNSYRVAIKFSQSSHIYELNLKRQKGLRKYYYLPMIKGNSQILTYDNLEQIWHFLPFQLKMLDIKMNYPASGSVQVFTLNNLLGSIADEKYVLIVMRIEGGCTFGIFIEGVVKTQASSEWYGSPSNFLFRLGKNMIKYECTRESTNYLFTGVTEFKVGDGPKGPAIKLSQNLQTIESYQSVTYRNEPFGLNSNGSNASKILRIEAFSLF